MVRQLVIIIIKIIKGKFQQSLRGGSSYKNQTTDLTIRWGNNFLLRFENFCGVWKILIGYQNRAEGMISNDRRSLPLPSGGMGAL